MEEIPILVEFGRDEILGFVRITKDLSKKLAAAMGELVIAPSQVMIEDDSNVVRTFAIRLKNPRKNLSADGSGVVYNITEIYYRDIHGKLLWKTKMTFKRLHSVGESLVWGYKNYIVRRVAVADNVQHVNLEKDSAGV